MISEENVKNYRDLFINLENINHLAACSRSPLLKSVKDSLNNYMNDIIEMGNPWDLWVNKVNEARTLFAKIINADPSEIAVLYSVSSCLNSLLSGFDYDNRNEIITSDLEFPTTNFILSAQKKYGAKIKTIKSKNYAIEPEDYLNSINNNTKMVTVTHVSSLNGYKQKIKEIAKITHEKGSYIYVDDYQSLGSGLMDVKNYDIDFMASGNLKWLLGLSGIAFMYVNKRVIKELKPTNIGWFSQKDPFKFGSEELDYNDDARRFESGTWSIPSVYGSIEGMKAIISTGVKNISDRDKHLMDYTMELIDKYKMKTITPETSDKRGNIAALSMKNPHEMEVYLNKKFRIITSARSDSLRLAPHFYNTENEIENAVLKIKDLL